MKVKATQILKDAAYLKEQKSKDYQGGIFTEEDYFPYGEKSYVHMLWTKMLRLRAVIEKDETNFESAEDTLARYDKLCSHDGSISREQEK